MSERSERKLSLFLLCAVARATEETVKQVGPKCYVMAFCIILGKSLHPCASFPFHPFSALFKIINSLGQKLSLTRFVRAEHTGALISVETSTVQYYNTYTNIKLYV